MTTSREKSPSTVPGTKDVSAKVRDKQKAAARMPRPEKPGQGLSGDGVGEEALDRSGPGGVGSSGALGWLGSPGRYQHY